MASRRPHRPRPPSRAPGVQPRPRPSEVTVWTALRPRTAVWTPPFLQASPTPSQPPQAVTSLRSPASFFPCRLPPRRLGSPRVSFLSPSSPFCTQLSSSENMAGIISSAHAKALGAKPLCSPAPPAASGEPPQALRPAVCRPHPQLSVLPPPPTPVLRAGRCPPGRAFLSPS